ncbi:MAG: DUF4281 domain-containing protein [Oscillochloris sp.]|nr:DUF4281 domain-containing protein [Oscillochloris sp.]
MERFFQYINWLPLPLWLAMMFAPRHPLTERASRSSTVFAVSAVNYLVSLLLALRQAWAEGVPGSFTSLRGVNALLGTQGGSLAAWAHMLALDLFTGAWIYRQCRRLEAPAWVRIPALFGTLMAGPAGLLYFLGWHAWKTGDKAFCIIPLDEG